EFHRMGRPELARARSGLADNPQELAVAVEHRNAPDEIRILDVHMALGHVNVAVAGVGDDVGWLGQGVRWISAHARLSQRHEHFAFRAELDDDAPLRDLSGKFREIVRARYTGVGHPHVAVAVHMDAVRPYEHSAAKAPDLLPGFVEMVNWICLGAETA